MLVEGLQAYLSANALVQAALGTASSRGDATNGIFPMVAYGTPNAPYLVYSQISGEPQTVSMQGTNRLQNARWRFSCHGSTYKQAKKLAHIVQQVLESVNGTLPAGNAEVHGSWLRSEIDTAEPLTQGTIFSTHVDLEFIYLDYDDEA